MTAPAACRAETTDTTSDETASANVGWADEVMPWISQFDNDLRELGGLGAVPFLSDDVVLDVRTVAAIPRRTEGIDDAIAYFDALSDGLQPIVERVTPSDFPYVDPYGLVLPIAYDRSARPGTTPPMPGHAVLFLDIGTTGIEKYQLLPAIDWWLDTDRTGRTRPADRALGLAEAWTRAWSGDDADELRATYAPDAILEDEFEALSVSGHSAIVDQWTLAPDATWSVVSIDDSPAVALWSPRLRDPIHDRASLAVLAQLQGSDADQCPGRIAVWWELDTEGRITHERRFRSVVDSRRCAAPGELLPMGWWTNRSPPGPADTASPEDLKTVTQQITESGETVEILNGTPSLAALVGWGLARFHLAELALPGVRSVTFTQYTDYCTEVQGRTIRLTDEDPLTGQAVAGGWKIVLCLEDDDVYIDDRCSDPSNQARYIALHELAHVWVDQHVDSLRRDHLLEWLELPTWNDRRFEWDQRGSEWAASVIAWGLMDLPMPLYELGDPPPEVRFDGFQLLTGRQPLQPEPCRADEPARSMR